MGDFDITNATASDLTNVQEDYSVAPLTTDGIEEAGETEWTNEKWEQYLGYYKTIPELTAVIDAKATWTVGKGFVADEPTTIILDQINGFGKDTFNTILENMIRTMHIGGDAFAEIILDGDDNLANLKPLDPSSIRIVANRQGRIKRYEQIRKVKGEKMVEREFQPDMLFHLARNRVADELHGVSVITAVENIILMRNEAMDDMKILMHRHVKPQRIWKLDTDDATEITKFKTTTDAATNKAENIYIPMGTVEHEIAAVSTNATLNPLPWVQNLNTYFYQATGVPDIVVGGSSVLTEASAKIAYLAWQQTIEEEQLFVEEQALMQLNLEISLTFPASLDNELLSDKPKEEEGTGEGVQPPEIQENESAVEPNDQTAELAGRQ